MSTPKTLALFTVLIALCSYSPAHSEDPPARVGRISYLEGTVSFQADNAPWAYATLNYPVMGGSSFWTEPDGRSEVQLGSVEIRMDHLTELQVLRADESATQLQVPQGVVNIHFSTPLVNGGIEVLTPLGAVELTQPGTYHIDSGQPTAEMPSNQARLTSLEGEMSIQGPGSAPLEVMPGETAILTGNPPSYTLQEGNATPFDNWALARERREEAHYAARYVSPYTTGYEDLDSYGQWATDPEYGAIWYPTVVDSGWAPYRDGHWAYIAPWGWTWVDNAPWGFAPFHYGRWAYARERWGWVPGEFAERPVYAPALVAFIGGAGWNPAFGNGHHASAVGWVPLAPHEIFHPYYPASESYLRNVNRSNGERVQINSITTNTIRNATVSNYANQRAATVVPSPVFAQSKPVRGYVMPASQEQLSRVPLTPTIAHIFPSPVVHEEGRPSLQSDFPELRQDNPSLHRTFVPIVKAPDTPHAPIAPVVFKVTPVAAGAVRQTPTSVPPQEMSRRATPLINYTANSPQVPRPPAQVRMPVTQTGIKSLPRPEPAPGRPAPNGASQSEIRHPEQHTHIEPTHQGWRRTPEHAQPHPPANRPTEHGQNEQRKP